MVSIKKFSTHLWTQVFVRVLMNEQAKKCFVFGEKKARELKCILTVEVVHLFRSETSQHLRSIQQQRPVWTSSTVHRAPASTRNILRTGGIIKVNVIIPYFKTLYVKVKVQHRKSFAILSALKQS